MKYEIGQKVETPFGIGKIFSVDDIRDEYGVLYHFEVQDFFRRDDLKPYKTPHEKFIDMGLHLKITKNWAGGVFSHEWWNDNNDRVVVFFVDEKVTTVYEGNNDIMRIIPEYLEWLEEEK